MKRMRHPILPRLVLLIAALAMTLTGFAHQVSDDRDSPELRAYIEIGGALSDICGDQSPAHALSNTCEACLIASNALAPQTIASVSLPDTNERLALFSCVPRVSDNAAPDQTHPARAPPHAVIV